MAEEKNKKVPTYKVLKEQYDKLLEAYEDSVTQYRRINIELSDAEIKAESEAEKLERFQNWYYESSDSLRIAKIQIKILKAERRATLKVIKGLEV